MSEQFVYFIQADEAGPIKIGFTSDDPKRRLNQLQTGNASVLKLLGAIKGSTTEERQLHSLLAEWRLQGEWFEPHPTVLATIQDALSAPDLGECFHCSFCFRSQHDAGALIRGAAANICSECITAGSEILAKLNPTSMSQ